MAERINPMADDTTTSIMLGLLSFMPDDVRGVISPLLDPEARLRGDHVRIWSFKGACLYRDERSSYLVIGLGNKPGEFWRVDMSHEVATHLLNAVWPQLEQFNELAGQLAGEKENRRALEAMHPLVARYGKEYAVEPTLPDSRLTQEEYLQQNELAQSIKGGLSVMVRLFKATRFIR